jgi:hypothetical protein
MILQLFRQTRTLSFERSYPAPVDTVWRAWTQPDLLRQWWARLTHDARSSTEGEEETSTIHHTNDLTLIERAGATTVQLHVDITKIGPKAKMAAFGMKWGYKQQLEKLEQLLSAMG